MPPRKKSAAATQQKESQASRATPNATRKRTQPLDDGPAGKRQRTLRRPKAATPSVKRAVPAKKAVKPAAQRARAAPRAAALINAKPTQRLDLYVFGGNSVGELGLGGAAGVEGVYQPQLNENLTPDTVGVVEIAVGGMHCAALTFDNRILTWGCNDEAALGRDTTWDGGMVDIKEGDESAEDSDSGINPMEVHPGQIDTTEIAEGTVFTQLAAGDNSTFALTEDGLVYGWGTFRSTNGARGFSPTTERQLRPTLISSLSHVKKIMCGSNHAVALTTDGSVYVWGQGDQSQLGRRVVEWRQKGGLEPRKAPFLKRIIDIGGGSDHTFAIRKDGSVFGWGANNHAQTGIVDAEGEFDPAISSPTLVTSLEPFGDIRQITGGPHNSFAVTHDGKCLSWGRLYAFATGLDINTLPREGVLRDDRGRPGILTVPTPIPGFKATSVAAGGDHALAVTRYNKVYSWGFNMDGRTGQKDGKDEDCDDDIEAATLLDCPALKDKNLVWAGAGGQFSILGAIP